MAFLNWAMAAITLIVTGMFIIYWVMVIIKNRAVREGIPEKIILQFDTTKTQGHLIVKQVREEQSAFKFGKISRWFLPVFLRQEDPAPTEMFFNEDDFNTYDVFGPGELDERFTVVASYPKKPYRLPEQFRRTVLGKAMMVALIERDIDTNIIDALKEGGERQKKIINEINTGEISKQFISRTGMLFEEHLQLIKKKYNIEEPEAKAKT